MYEQQYARSKSSLTGSRVKTDPAFKKTMENAGTLARASKIGKAIYEALPAGWRQFWMYRSFTGEAIMLMKTGKTEDEVLELMMKRYVEIRNDPSAPLRIEKCEMKNEEARTVKTLNDERKKKKVQVSANNAITRYAIRKPGEINKRRPVLTGRQATPPLVISGVCAIRGSPKAVTCHSI